MLNKELLRHIEILKTVPEIKEDLKNNDYVISTTWNKNLWIKGTNIFNSVRILECQTKEEALWICISDVKKEEEYKDHNFNFEVIIENVKDVEERHLRMFLEKDKQRWKCYTIMNWWILELNEWTITQLDNSKSYMDQSSEFFKKLNDWICKEFNIKK